MTKIVMFPEDRDWCHDGLVWAREIMTRRVTVPGDRDWCHDGVWE